ncbi:hypothetical protein ABZW02_21110 [Streptomyces sp. NPDC005180]|uniref:hypothetical protein n=1 Tax=Streptomyces sp. NPDC005180 TaxID=3156868 RepID=UPI0033B5AF16
MIYGKSDCPEPAGHGRPARPAAVAAPGTTPEPGAVPPGPDGRRGFEVSRALLEATGAEEGHWVVLLEGTVEPHEHTALRHALEGTDRGRRRPGHDRGPAEEDRLA